MKFHYSTGDRPLAGYTIKRGLGSGGFGEVYFATSDSGKEVALKLVQNHLDVELRGVSHCLNLKHPNLLSIFDVRETESEECWIVMEYLQGDSLSDVIKRSPKGLPREEMVAWMEGMCSAVAFLHAQGIIHRDLKPSNIFRDEGVVKIGDYGLSKFISASRRSVQTESIGTVHYVAPEVAHGRYGKEIDLYALGIMLYEMLTGNVPFDGESLGEIVMKHLTARPDLSLIPKDFRGVIRRALHKDPAKRYQDAQELLADIRAAAAGNPQPAGAEQGERCGTDQACGFDWRKWAPGVAEYPWRDKAHAAFQEFQNSIRESAHVANRWRPRPPTVPKVRPAMFVLAMSRLLTAATLSVGLGLLVGGWMAVSGMYPRHIGDDFTALVGISVGLITFGSVTFRGLERQGSHLPLPAFLGLGFITAVILSFGAGLATGALVLPLMPRHQNEEMAVISSMVIGVLTLAVLASNILRLALERKQGSSSPRRLAVVASVCLQLAGALAVGILATGLAALFLSTLTDHAAEASIALGCAAGLFAAGAMLGKKIRHSGAQYHPVTKVFLYGIPALIISVSIGLLALGLGFVFLHPWQHNEEEFVFLAIGSGLATLGAFGVRLGSPNWDSVGVEVSLMVVRLLSAAVLAVGVGFLSGAGFALLGHGRLDEKLAIIAVGAGLLTFGHNASKIVANSHLLTKRTETA